MVFNPLQNSIDLHIHSTASDGSLSCEQILSLAKKNKIKAISITDHDTIEGMKSIWKKTLPKYPKLICGVEISCEPPSEFKELGNIHVLGYGFSVYDKELNNLLDKLKESREQRNPKIIEKLNKLGINISLEDVAKRFQAIQTGRPHIAEFLKEAGYVTTFKQAFDKFLGKDKPAYVNRYTISCELTIKTILSAGGVPVLAHPGLLNFSDKDKIPLFIDTLKSYGLKGIEVFYTDHDSLTTNFYQKLAHKKNLLMTGGSDFHGDFNENVKIGTGKNNNIYVDYSLYQKLNLCLEEIKQEHNDIIILEKNLNFFFKDLSLLKNALCHRSYANENPELFLLNNERLEFLGDAILGLCIGHLLMEKNTLADEGTLSKQRSTLVSETALADMARDIDLGRFISLGKGEYFSKGFEKNSILSDTFEAIIAAVYLDSNFETVFDLIKKLFNKNIEKILTRKNVSNFNSQNNDNYKFSHNLDYKSQLQELIQQQYAILPDYVVTNEKGPDHNKIFEVRLYIADMEFEGFGRTKKSAEQDCAKNALKALNQLA